MATSVNYWQAYFHAHARVTAHEQLHGRLPDEVYHELFWSHLRELLKPTM